MSFRTQLSPHDGGRNGNLPAVQRKLGTKAHYFRAVESRAHRRKEGPADFPCQREGISSAAGGKGMSGYPDDMKRMI